jgi:hypothetical protein
MIYEHDHFHPLEKNEIEDTLNNNDALNNLKKMDKGYQKVSRKLNKVWVDGKYYKNITIEFYCSSENGYIRNAITGYRSRVKVGSSEEDTYFKVKMASGECKKNSGVLFYDSPEQFEKHQFVILKLPIKEQWYNKQIQLKR